MTETQPFASPNQCELLPRLTLAPIKCDSCSLNHGWTVSVAWLFWGVWHAWGLEEATYVEDRPAPQHPIGMTSFRWQAVMDGLDLIPSEVADGWHFCETFEGLLVGPGMPEVAYCKCGEGKAE